MRLFTMPTDRVCIENAISFLPEIEYVRKIYNTDTLFLITGDGDEKLDRENTRLLAKEYDKDSSLKKRMKYVSKKEMDTWLRNVLDSFDDTTAKRLADILSVGQKKYSYGVILNKLFLIAISLNADSLHRRDSDTFLEQSENPEEFPFVNEIKYLGKFYSEFSELGYNEEKRILMVGSNYYGNWAGDFSSLYKKDPNLLYRHIGLNYPGRQQDEIIELAKQRFVKTDQDAITETKVVYDRLVELGNCSFYNIYRDFPVSPQTQTTATDYLLHDLMFLYRNPPVYHPYCILHKHTATRKKISQVVQYHLKSARYKIYNYYMHKIMKQLSKKRSWANALELADAIESEVLKSPDRSEVQYIINELISIFTDSALDDFLIVAENIQRLQL